MDSAEPNSGEVHELAEWNRRRQAFARLAGVPYIPVKPDSEGPAVDEDAISKLIAGELPTEDALRVISCCWQYPAWIRASTRLGIARLFTKKDLLDILRPPTELG